MYILWKVSHHAWRCLECRDESSLPFDGRFLPREQLQNIVQRFFSDPEKPLLSDFNEPAADYEQRRHGPPMQDLTGESDGAKETMTAATWMTRTHIKEGHMNKADSVEDIEESQSHPLQYKRSIRRPVYISDTVTLNGNDAVTFEETTRGSENNELNLALKEKLDSIENNKTGTHTFLPLSKDALLCKVKLNLKLDEQGHTAHYKERVVTKGSDQKDSVS